jgi:hypothetical protein
MLLIEKYRTLKSKAKGAEHFLAMIGRPQRTTAKSAGYLHSVEVKTTISYQETDGAKNYHAHEAFDAAFSRVIKANFPHLAALAIEAMQADAAQAGHEASVELDALRAEIDALCSPSEPPILSEREVM